MSPVLPPPPGSSLFFTSLLSALFSALTSLYSLSSSSRLLLSTFTGSTRLEPSDLSPTPSSSRETSTRPSSRSTPMDTSSVLSTLTTLPRSRFGTSTLAVFNFARLPLTFAPPPTSYPARVARPSVTRSSTTALLRTTPTSTKCRRSLTLRTTRAMLELPPLPMMMSLRSSLTSMMLPSLMRCELGFQ